MQQDIQTITKEMMNYKIDRIMTEINSQVARLNEKLKSSQFQIYQEMSGEIKKNVSKLKEFISKNNLQGLQNNDWYLKAVNRQLNMRTTMNVTLSSLMLFLGFFVIIVLCVLSSKLSEKKSDFI